MVTDDSLSPETCLKSEYYSDALNYVKSPLEGVRKEWFTQESFLWCLKPCWRHSCLENNIFKSEPILPEGTLNRLLDVSSDWTKRKIFKNIYACSVRVERLFEKRLLYQNRVLAPVDSSERMLHSIGLQDPTVILEKNAIGGSALSWIKRSIGYDF